ncbi:MAG TPA: ABC-2 transporter permease [Terriglobales bacterium]|nr:ABC-2 transporter permease [Terriglobales bacterium]
MIPFLALVRKDLRIFFNDRKAVIIGLVVPIVLASFFGYMFGGQGGDAATSKLAVLVIDEDGSDISRSLVSSLAGDKNLDVKPSTVDGAKEVVRKGKATAAIVIPKNFGQDAGRALFTGANKPEIGLLYDPSHKMELEMVKGILSGAVMQTVSKEMFNGSSGREMVNDSLARVENNPEIRAGDRKVLRDLLGSVKELNERRAAEQTATPAQGSLSGGLTMPFETHEEALTSGNNVAYNGYAHAFAGMGVQFILFMGMDVGIALLLLRQTGLWQRLRAAPLSRTMLLGSRTVSAALIAGFILTAIFTFARVVFGVRVLGSFMGFVGVCIAFSLMTAAFGLMIAALGGTPEATRGFSVMATLIMVMLGGAWVPTFVFPPWLRKLTLVVPTRWAMDGLDAMTWRGFGISEALAPIAVLLMFALLFGTVAVMRFRWRAEG